MSEGFIFGSSGWSGNKFNSATAQQTWMEVNPRINQSGTAAYDGLHINGDVVGTGDGTSGDGNNLFRVSLAGSTKFRVTHDGNVGIGGTPTAQLHTTKGRIVGTTRYTTTQTLDADDHHVFCDTDGGAFTVTLPAGVDGTVYKIINCGTSGNNLTVSPNGAELLIGANSSFTVADGETIDITFETTEGWY